MCARQISGTLLHSSLLPPLQSVLELVPSIFSSETLNKLCAAIAPLVGPGAADYCTAVASLPLFIPSPESAETMCETLLPNLIRWVVVEGRRLGHRRATHAGCWQCARVAMAGLHA